MAPKKEPRGIRNNNPGNLERVAYRPWIGEEAFGDGRFCIFKQPQYGIRALAITLKNYMLFHNLRTVPQIIARFAPSTENNTAFYVDDVLRRTGLRADEILNPARDIPALVNAIIIHENGYNPYTPEVIAAAFRSAPIIADISKQGD